MRFLAKVAALIEGQKTLHLPTRNKSGGVLVRSDGWGPAVPRTPPSLSHKKFKRVAKAKSNVREILGPNAFRGFTDEVHELDFLLWQGTGKLPSYRIYLQMSSFGMSGKSAELLGNASNK